MSEGIERVNALSNEQIREESQPLLGGVLRVDSLWALSSPAYLQATFDQMVRNPRLVNNDTVGATLHGGQALITDEYARLRSVFSQPEADADAMTARCLAHFFRFGFGMVERTITHDVPISRAPMEDLVVMPQAYAVWRRLPHGERRAEMHFFLRSQDADLLGTHFLEDYEDTILNHFNATLAFSSRLGRETQLVAADRDERARLELVEGAMAAFFLLREHYVAQSIDDFAQFGVRGIMLSDM